jgi:hypothetical protein
MTRLRSIVSIMVAKTRFQKPMYGSMEVLIFLLNEPTRPAMTLEPEARNPHSLSRLVGLFILHRELSGFFGRAAP